MCVCGYVYMCICARVCLKRRTLYSTIDKVRPVADLFPHWLDERVTADVQQGDAADGAAGVVGGAEVVAPVEDDIFGELEDAGVGVHLGGAVGGVLPPDLADLLADPPLAQESAVRAHVDARWVVAHH